MWDIKKKLRVWQIKKYHMDVVNKTRACVKYYRGWCRIQRKEVVIVATCV